METKYELWQHIGTRDTTFIPADHHQKEMLTKEAEVIWTCTANSWEEACTKKNEFLGFAPYKPMT